MGPLRGRGNPAQVVGREQPLSERNAVSQRARRHSVGSRSPSRGRHGHPSPSRLRRMRENLSSVRDALDDSTVIVSATKGLEVGTAKRMSQLMDEELPSSLSENVCALSGPNLAREIIDGKPSSTVVASPNEDAAVLAQSLLKSSRFRVYTNTDIVGVEFGGALKKHHSDWRGGLLRSRHRRPTPRPPSLHVDSQK